MLTEYQKKYHEINKERDRKRTKEWSVSERGRAWRTIHERERLAKLREKALEKLGGAVCKHCGFSDVRALQIDHVNGGGYKERKHKSPSKVIQNIRDMSVREARKKYQVLCANCNFIKRYTHNELAPRTKYTLEKLEEHGGRIRKKKQS